MTPRAYLVFKPNEVLSFKGGVAGGYKVPSVKELTDGIYEPKSRRKPSRKLFRNEFSNKNSVKLTDFFVDFNSVRMI